MIFSVPADLRVKMKVNVKEGKKLAFPKQLRKTVEHENDNDINRNGDPWNSPQRGTMNIG